MDYQLSAIKCYHSQNQNIVEYSHAAAPSIKPGPYFARPTTEGIRRGPSSPAKPALQQPLPRSITSVISRQQKRITLRQEKVGPTGWNHLQFYKSSYVLKNKNSYVFIVEHHTYNLTFAETTALCSKNSKLKRTLASCAADQIHHFLPRSCKWNKSAKIKMLHGNVQR